MARSGHVPAEKWLRGPTCCCWATPYSNTHACATCCRRDCVMCTREDVRTSARTCTHTRVCCVYIHECMRGCVHTRTYMNATRACCMYTHDECMSTRTHARMLVGTHTHTRAIPSCTSCACTCAASRSLTCLSMRVWLPTRDASKGASALTPTRAAKTLAQFPTSRAARPHRAPL